MWIVEIHAENLPEMETTTIERLADACATSRHNATDGTLWVRAEVEVDAPERAVSETITTLRGILPAGWRVTEVRAITSEEEARQLMHPRPMELAGTSDAARILGRSKQRVANLVARDPNAPSPLGRTSGGPVYMADSIRHYRDTRDDSDNAWKWR